MWKVTHQRVIRLCLSYFCWLQITAFVDSVDAQECCSGNEIWALVDCILGELHVEYVDLMDASHVSVPVRCCVCVGKMNFNPASGEGRGDRKRESGVLS